ncbi:MAG: imidazoleglycerol-phosphate dehydratase HisB, partial [Proteobacteria bacterium]|nr:imidazoleglycerol-phosphate dehydratase HisB [Pseudomonadota bacterium]
MQRSSEINRETTETNISLSLTIDGDGQYDISTPVPFLNHMLELMTRHGLFDLKIKADGDVEIDGHHTVEDIGICLGQAFKEALGDKKGIKRYGNAIVPMDEALAEVALDISGRASLTFNVDIPKEKVGDFDVELAQEFFQALVSNGGITLHVDLRRGANTHHCLEAVFKAFGRAMDAATSLDSRVKG